MSAPTAVDTTTSSTSTTTASTTTLPPAPASTEMAAAPAAVPEPRFAAEASPIEEEVADRMQASWRPGCPVGLEQLRYITVTHWDFAGDVVSGELVVHEDHAEPIITVMERLFAVGFPIEQMQLVDVYDGDDDRSMAANNTSAFNCREVAWRPGVWSNHALGQAIDINPLINPYVADGVVLPPAGEAFIDRSTRAPGGIYADDEVVRAFAEIGWGWGGDWPTAKDWQHFSASGR